MIFNSKHVLSNGKLNRNKKIISYIKLVEVVTFDTRMHLKFVYIIPLFNCHTKAKAKNYFYTHLFSIALDHSYVTLGISCNIKSSLKREPAINSLCMIIFHKKVLLYKLD